MKKIIIGVCLFLIGTMMYGQGLKNIIVEKYYISNAADAAGSSGTLPAGSTTYRIYAEMQTGYKFKAVYGVPSPQHQVIFTTTTEFFNNTDYGSGTPTFSKTNAAKNSTLIDSYLSVGAACAGNFGVLKTEDDGVNNIVNNTSPKILQNNDVRAGIPLTTQDGLLAGSPEAVTVVGFADTDINVFGDGSANGNSFISSNGAWSSLNGATGPTSNNRVLIAQITTDGVFHYELNIQLQTPSLGVERYVASNPAAGEFSIETVPGLVGTYGAPNIVPTVSITAPATGSTYITGDVVTINSTANDADGSIASIEYFVDGVSKGMGTLTPSGHNATATINWTSTYSSTPHTLTVKATDNDGAVTTSTAVFVTVNNHVAPTITITDPTGGSTKNINDVVAITAAPVVFDGSTVSSVQFFVNGTSVATVSSAPWTTNWTATEGTANITAKVTDSRGATTTSSAVSITVVDPSGPPYEITSSTSSCREGDIFCMPVVRNKNPLANCIGFDVVMHYNPSKVKPTGFVTLYNDLSVSPALQSYAMDIKESQGIVNLSIFLNSNAGANQYYNGTGKVFCVEFSKTLNFNGVDTASFSITSMLESYNTGTISRPVKDGKYITYKETTFTGKLKFWADDSPIKYDAVNPTDYLLTNIYGNNSSCNGQTATAVQPNLTGSFNYDITNGLYINVERNILPGTDVQPVINGFDAFLTKKVLVNDPTFLPNVFQMIAMDVNRDGVVSAGDLSQINQRTVMMIPEFKQAWNYNDQGVKIGGDSKDWLFVETTTYLNDLKYRRSTSYPSSDASGFSKYSVPVVPFCHSLPVSDLTSCTQIGEETYTGVLLGDVNGNYKNIAADGLLKSGEVLVINPNEDKVVFDLSKAVDKGNYVEIPISVSSNDIINSLDFSLQFNESSLVYDSYFDNTTYISSLANYNATDKTLRFTSYSLQNYELGHPLFTLRFTKVGTKINVSDIYSLKTYLNGDPAGIEVLTKTTGISNNNNDINVKIYPNPTQDVVNVSVSEKSNIQMFDTSGKEFFSKSNVNANQTEIINISNFAAGIYSVKVSNDKFVTIKKLVVK